MKISLVTLGDPQRLSGGYLYHRRMAEAAARHDAAIRFVSLPDRGFPLSLMGGRGAAHDAARNADLIVIDSIAAALVAPWVSAMGIPSAASVHQRLGGIDHGRLRTTLQARLDARTYHVASRLLVASDALASDLAASGIPKDKLVVVPPGRDVADRLEEPESSLRQGRGVALLCVANWVPRKGIVELLDAFERLSEDAATLHLAGDTDADPRYAALVRARLARRALAERVVVHGPLSRERVAGLYTAADIFVLPSFVEPYGTVYGEAMAAGLPVVGWRAGNLPYLARDEEEGLLVAPGDVDGLAAALLRVAGDAELRERLGTAARSRAATFPTWAESAALFFRVLREIVALQD